MDIPVGNALGQFGQFLSSLPLQLLADAALSDFFQDPLDIGRGTGVSGPFVVVIPFHCATLRRGERRGVGQGDTSILLLSYGLAGTRRGLPFHRQPFFFRGSRRSGRSFLHGIFFLLAAIGRSVRFRFFLLLGCIGGQLCGSGTDTCSRGTPAGAGRRAAGDRLRFTSSLSAAASQSRKQLLEHVIGIALTAAFCRLIGYVLAVIHKVLDVRPAADQYDVGGTASIPEVLTGQGCIQVPQQGKDRLNPLGFLSRGTFQGMGKNRREKPRGRLKAVFGGG